MHATAVRNRYMADAVTTVSPARLVTMLYDALVADMDKAVAALAGGDLEAVNRHLLHAQDIVSELQASLDVAAWEGAPALASLYAFVLRELIGANVAKDGARVLACREVVEPLRAAWHQAAAVFGGGGSAAGSAGSAAS